MDAFERRLAQFLTSLQGKPISARTVRLYRDDLLAFQRWFEQVNQGACDPIAVLRADVRAWLETQQASSRPATVNRRLSSLRAFYGWAERQGLLSQNPLAGMRSLKVLPPAAGALEPQALENLLRVARQAGSARDRAMLEVLADAGLRPRELCALRRRDLERQGAQVWLVIEQGRHRRRVDLSTRAHVALSDYLAGQPPAAAEAPLFTSRSGQAVTPFILWHVLRGCAAQARLAEVTPLDLRQAAVLRFLRTSDADLLAAGERFGERDLNRLARLLAGVQDGD